MGMKVGFMEGLHFMEGLQMTMFEGKTAGGKFRQCMLVGMSVVFMILAGLVIPATVQIEPALAIMNGAPPCPGDVDGDGIAVDIDDLLDVIACFGQTVAGNPDCAIADVAPPPSGDGIVNY